MSHFLAEADVPGGPHAGARARRLVNRELSGRLSDESLADVSLLVTELVANGVWHGGAGPGTTLHISVSGDDDAVRIEVENPGTDGNPAQRHPDMQGGGGLGLHIVERVASRWGVRRAPRIAVWFEVDRVGRSVLQRRPRSLGAVPPAKRLEVEIEGRRLSLSNLDKPMYPAAGFTKGHVIDYYTRVAPALLPHLRGRPLTLKRYPDGVDGPYFYEKQCPSHRPDWVRTARVDSSRARDGKIDFCVVEDLATLVWLANLADLELHSSLALAEAYASPTVVAFDLDPGPPATVVECAQVALELRTVFDHLGMHTFAKTSGSKGMQVYVPLNTPATYEQTSGFAHGLAQLLERRHPDLVLSEMTRAKRPGKVFVDWSQNSRHKTTVSVYSLRALPEPTVSTPLTWDEVQAATAPDDLVFRSGDVLDRVAEHGDLFAGVVELEQRLPEAL